MFSWVFSLARVARNHHGVSHLIAQLLAEDQNKPVSATGITEGTHISRLDRASWQVGIHNQLVPKYGLSTYECMIGTACQGSISHNSWDWGTQPNW